MSRKVLVVDDEKLIVKGIRFSLEQDGMEVDCAYDGEEAVEKAKDKKYDIILLDLMLPKMDGIAVLKKAQELESAPRALVMTGFMTEYVGAMAAELGVQYFMSKPCDCREIGRAHV